MAVPNLKTIEISELNLEEFFKKLTEIFYDYNHLVPVIITDGVFKTKNTHKEILPFSVFILKDYIDFFKNY